MATTREDIIGSAGSKYVHSMTIESLMSAIKKGYRSIGFVGPSCNIDAIHKMQNSPYGLLHMFMRANILKLGLFCMDTFEYKGLKEFFNHKGINLGEIEEMKIRRGKLKVRTNSRENIYSLKELDSFRCSSCMFCLDLTAEKADISFGGVGSEDGYTTVLVRSGLGLEIIQDAADRGYLDIAPLEDRGIDRVLNQAKAKKVQMYMIKRRAGSDSSGP